MATANPFNFGDVALDEGFTDRERDLAELKADIRNGQNVVVFAPRRYGKSSLMWRAAQELAASNEALVAQVDLMRVTTKEQLASKLSQAIYEGIATPLLRARDRAARIFESLRVRPMVTVEPMTGNFSFSFTAGHDAGDVDATLERLFELPAELAAERGKSVALVFDEFQEVIALDPRLPALMRAVFQMQPQISHVYLGSKRSMMRSLFNDVNEPFWRSARQMELGPIPAAEFGQFIRRHFDSTRKRIDDRLIAEVLTVTGCHPYGTQELCYALWEETEATVTDDALARAVDRVLRAENAHFTYVWDTIPRTQRLVLQALAIEPAARLLSEEYRARHGLPAASSVQRAVGELVAAELVARSGRGAYAIAEPFLAQWIRANAV
ncbi:MAG: AAA family ATPase [Gaiellaceae bacterium]